MTRCLEAVNDALRRWVVLLVAIPALVIAVVLAAQVAPTQPGAEAQYGVAINWSAGPAAGSTVSTLPGQGYDTPAVSRLDVGAPEPAKSRFLQVTAGGDGAASLAVEVEGTSMTPGVSLVTPRGVPPLRQSYLDDFSKLGDEVAAWRRAGADPEFIAREANANRRALGMKYKELTPEPLRSQIRDRNLAKYADEWGPTIDWFRARGDSWEQIIESSLRSGGGDLGF